MKWSELTTLEFVKIYLKQECLWNPSHGAYKLKYKRDEAYWSIISEFKDLTGKSMSVPEVKNKIKNLRTTYSQEVHKILQKSSPNSIYAPSLVWFQEMDQCLKHVSYKRLSIANYNNYDNNEIPEVDSSSHTIWEEHQDLNSTIYEEAKPDPLMSQTLINPDYDTALPDELSSIVVKIEPPLLHHKRKKIKKENNEIPEVDSSSHTIWEEHQDLNSTIYEEAKPDPLMSQTLINPDYDTALPDELSSIVVKIEPPLLHHKRKKIKKENNEIPEVDSSSHTIWEEHQDLNSTIYEEAKPDPLMSQTLINPDYDTSLPDESSSIVVKIEPTLLHHKRKTKKIPMPKIVVRDFETLKNKISVKRPPKTSTERSRECRERKRAIKAAIQKFYSSSSIISKTKPKTPAERSRDYRARKKARQNEENQESNDLTRITVKVEVHEEQENSQLSTSTLPKKKIKTSTERCREFRARKKSLINLRENIEDFQTSSNIINANNNNNVHDSDASKNGRIQQNLEVNSNNSVINIPSNLAGYPGTSHNSIIQHNVETNSSGANSVIDQMSSKVASFEKVYIKVEDSDIPSTSKAQESIVNNTDGISFMNNSDMSKPCVIDNTEAGASEVDVKNLLVKREPLDIPEMLYQLSSGYTATIVDIEDPFLAKEISDNSESEDEPDDIKL